MSDTDDNMTPEERLNWLRERGVLIETAEERKAGITTDADATEFVTYVRIPSDASQPMTELKLPIGAAGTGDLLQFHLKSAFSDKRSVDIGLLKDQAAKNFGSEEIPEISESTLHSVAAEGSVEVFRLVPPMESNHYRTINFYLDEVGLLKKLPLNARASQYALKAGFNPAPQFYGDIYVGRLQSKPVTTNIDFKLGEDTSFDAVWLTKAMTENLEFQSKMNQLTGKVGELQPLADGEDGLVKEEEDCKWTQTDDEIEVVFTIPTTSSRDVKVRFLPSSLEVLVKGVKTFVLGFFSRVDPDGCTWTIEKKGEHVDLILSCEKVEAVTWPRLKR